MYKCVESKENEAVAAHTTYSCLVRLGGSPEPLGHYLVERPQPQRTTAVPTFYCLCPCISKGRWVVPVTNIVAVEAAEAVVYRSNSPDCCPQLRTLSSLSGRVSTSRIRVILCLYDQSNEYSSSEFSPSDGAHCFYKNPVGSSHNLFNLLST